MCRRSSVAILAQDKHNRFDSNRPTAVRGTQPRKIIVIAPSNICKIELSLTLSALLFTFCLLQLARCLLPMPALPKQLAKMEVWEWGRKWQVISSLWTQISSLSFSTKSLKQQQNVLKTTSIRQSKGYVKSSKLSIPSTTRSTSPPMKHLPNLNRKSTMLWTLLLLLLLPVQAICKQPQMQQFSLPQPACEQNPPSTFRWPLTRDTTGLPTLPDSSFSQCSQLLRPWQPKELMPFATKPTSTGRTTPSQHWAIQHFPAPLPSTSLEAMRRPMQPGPAKPRRASVVLTVTGLSLQYLPLRTEILRHLSILTKIPKQKN